MGKRQAGLLACVATLGVACEAPRGEDNANRERVRASAEVRNAQGDVLGTVEFLQGPHGTLVQGRLTGLPSGSHGFHLHEVGRCDPPDFQTAGGHYNPAQRGHGFLSPEGPHEGDLPNLRVDEDGNAAFDFFAFQITDLRHALEGDGVALLVHERADDYVTDPSGEAGPRIGCGVLVRTE